MLGLKRRQLTVSTVTVPRPYKPAIWKVLDCVGVCRRQRAHGCIIIRRDSVLRGVTAENEWMNGMKDSRDIWI